MDVVKHFNVLGIGTDVLVASASTRDSFSICRFDCEPGDGPPPHSHALGDEVFMVISGDFELFNGSEWKTMPIGHLVPVLRGGVHTFRNSGNAPGKLLSIGVSGRHDLFLEEISPLTMPEDAVRFMEISERYGISYPPAGNGTSEARSVGSAGKDPNANRHFSVLGEDVEIVVSHEATDGRLMVLTQTSPPCGGVPIHIHVYEDEIFSVMEGEYEFFNGKAWVKYSKGDVWCALRGCPHGFRNCGNSDGKIHAMAVPGSGLEGLLKGVSGLEAPEGLPQFMEICRGYGVTFA